MKKLLSILTVFAVWMLISCGDNDEGKMSETAEKNLEAMHGITASFEKNDFSNLGDYVADNAVDHSGETGEIIGLEALKAEYARMMAPIKNMKTTTIAELANDEYVMSWQQFNVVLAADWMGKKAGEAFSMNSMEVGKFKDGKMTDHWTFVDPAEMMKMMGGAMPVMGDSASMMMTQ